jgi:hypothetical protein
MLARVKLLIDFTSIGALTVLAISGFVLWFALEGEGQRRGSGATAEESWAGISRGDWVDLHDAFAVAFLGLMTVHIIVNLNFVFVTLKGLLPGHNHEAPPGQVTRAP